MSIAFFFRVLRWNACSTLRDWHLLVIVALSVFIGWRSSLYALGMASSSSALGTANVWDAVFISFAGPGVWSGSILEMLRWFVPHLLFFYLFGDLANEELRQRGCWLVPLVGSRLWWWLGKVVTLLVLVIGYTLLSLAIVIVSSTLSLPWSWDLSTLLQSGALWSVPDSMRVETLLGWIGVSWGSALFAMALLQITLSIWWSNAFYAFMAISAVAVLSWLLGIENPHLVRWLPGSQSMLLRHTFFDPDVPGFSLSWSLLYNTVVSLTALGVSVWRVHRLDIFDHSA